MIFFKKNHEFKNMIVGLDLVEIWVEIAFTIWSQSDIFGDLGVSKIIHGNRVV